MIYYLFANLEIYLKQKQWQDVNEETEKILLEISEDGL